MTTDKTPTDALAQLRHLYANLTNGGVRDTASAKRIAEGLLSPAIAALEKWGSLVVAGEVVAWRVRRHDAPNYWIVFLHYPVDAMADPEREVQPLFATPQPAQAQAGAVPLTHDEALDAFCHTPGIHQFVQAFMAGVRFAEQHHGIKEGGQHGA